MLVKKDKQLKRAKINVFENKEGSVTLETILSLTMFVIFFVLVLAFFLFIYSFSDISRQTEILATAAERQGGLTVEDVNYFEERMSRYNFITSGEVVVDAYTIPSGHSALNVAPLNEDGYYISRDSMEKIVIRVTTPSNNVLLKPVLSFFGIEKDSDSYTIERTVYSERY